MPKGNPHPHKKHAPARGSGGDKPAGGIIGMPAQGLGVRLPNGRFQGALMGQGGALGYQRALEIAQLPLTKPVVDKDGKPVLDANGKPMQVTDNAAVANVLRAGEVLMNRDFGQPVARTLVRNVGKWADLTPEELAALAADDPETTR